MTKDRIRRVIKARCYRITLSKHYTKVEEVPKGNTQRSLLQKVFFKNSFQYLKRFLKVVSFVCFCFVLFSATILIILFEKENLWLFIKFPEFDEGERE